MSNPNESYLQPFSLNLLQELALLATQHFWRPCMVPFLTRP